MQYRDRDLNDELPDPDMEQLIDDAIRDADGYLEGVSREHIGHAIEGALYQAMRRLRLGEPVYLPYLGTVRRHRALVLRVSGSYLGPWRAVLDGDPQWLMAERDDWGHGDAPDPRECRERPTAELQVRGGWRRRLTRLARRAMRREVA